MGKEAEWSYGKYFIKLSCNRIVLEWEIGGNTDPNFALNISENMKSTWQNLQMTDLVVE